MFRTMFPVLCGCVVAFVICLGSSAADQAAPGAAAPPETGVRSCWYACDTWTLYPTQAACLESCPEWIPCERVCF
jgi:hypothetical protein